jgi:hypothetical protein
MSSEWAKAVKYFSRSFVCIDMRYKSWGVTGAGPRRGGSGVGARGRQQSCRDFPLLMEYVKSRCFGREFGGGLNRNEK